MYDLRSARTMFGSINILCITVQFGCARLMTMASITLKNTPEVLHQYLREAARKNRRSLNGEVLVRLGHRFVAEPDRVAVRELIAEVRAADPPVDHTVIADMRQHGRS